MCGDVGPTCVQSITGRFVDGQRFGQRRRKYGDILVQEVWHIKVVLTER